MNPRVKFLSVMLVAALVGLMLQSTSPVGGAFWPPHEDGPEPTGSQLALFMVVGVIEALAFGAGVAFLLFGRAALARAPGATKGWATAAYVAIGWGLVSWVPHTSMHVSNGPDDLGRLILIEYMFHVTLVASAVVLAVFFWRVLQASPSRSLAPEERRTVKTAAR